MDKIITRTTGGWTFTIHVAVDAYSGERYIGIDSVSGDVIRCAHAYLTELQTKALIEALGGYYNEG